MTSGIVIINKPIGVTSRFIVDEVGKKFGTRKVGHTGTLDPMATGVLIICVNEATKLVETLTSTDKAYQVSFELGFETDTLDITGKIIAEAVSELSKDEITKVINSYQKTYIQEVPKYSAVKVDGKKLYEYARENRKVELPKREVNIKAITNIEFNKNEITFDCVVSKGTYIRSLVRDIGVSCNTYATMTSLVRTKQGDYKLEDASSVEDCKIIPTEELFNDAVELEVNNIEMIRNGNVLNHQSNEPYIRLIHNGKLVAIYRLFKEGMYKPLVNFVKK